MDSLTAAILAAVSFFNSLIGSLVLLAIMGVLMVMSLILLSRSRKKNAGKKNAGKKNAGDATANGTAGGTAEAVEPTIDAGMERPAAGADHAAPADAVDALVPGDHANPADSGGAPADAQPGDAQPGMAPPAGFSFFRRKKKTNTDGGLTSAVEEGVSPALHAVEQEMLATRQLYLNGHISKDVYVAETRALYARAKAQDETA